MMKATIITALLAAIVSIAAFASPMQRLVSTPAPAPAQDYCVEQARKMWPEVVSRPWPGHQHIEFRTPEEIAARYFVDGCRVGKRAG